MEIFHRGVKRHFAWKQIRLAELLPDRWIEARELAAHSSVSRGPGFVTLSGERRSIPTHNERAPL
jgi:hypothetical protein